MVKQLFLFWFDSSHDYVGPAVTKIISNYTEKCPVRIWKRYIPLLIDLLISNNFFFYDIFLRNAYFTSYRSSKYTSELIFFLLIFLA